LRFVYEHDCAFRQGWTVSNIDELPTCLFLSYFLVTDLLPLEAHSLISSTTLWAVGGRGRVAPTPQNSIVLRRFGFGTRGKIEETRIEGTVYLTVVLRRLHVELSKGALLLAHRPPPTISLKLRHNTTSIRFQPRHFTLHGGRYDAAHAHVSATIAFGNWQCGSTMGMYKKRQNAGSRDCVLRHITGTWKYAQS
jgi:hypothetical protein